MHIVPMITNTVPVVSDATHAYWSPLKDMVVIFPVLRKVLYFLCLQEKVVFAAWNGIDQEGAVLTTKNMPESQVEWF